MRKFIASTIIVLTFCAATFTYAEPVKKITNFTIIKVLTTGNNSGRFTIIEKVPTDKEWDGWVTFTVKSKKELNKATTYFSKLDLDKNAVIYIRDNMIVGVTSAKYGNFGTPPSNTVSTSVSKTYVGTLSGCEMHQGVMSCGITIDDTNFHINNATTNSKLMKKLYLKKDIGRKVKIVGTLEGEADAEYKSIKARSIQFIK